MPLLLLQALQLQFQFQQLFLLLLPHWIPHLYVLPFLLLLKIRFLKLLLLLPLQLHLKLLQFLSQEIQHRERYQ